MERHIVFCEKTLFLHEMLIDRALLYILNIEKTH
jgi:hypothetical protein